MKFLPSSLEQLIEALRILPGIGQKSAERLAFFLLKSNDTAREKLGRSILEVKENLHYCPRCFHFAEQELCAICQDHGRQQDVLCIVEDALDLVAIEKSGVYRGLFHVLGGLISPLEGIGPSGLKIKELEERIAQGGFSEVIIALNPTLEGEATSVHIAQRLNPYGVQVTRPARGLPMGGNLEFTDDSTLQKAFESRSHF